MLIGVPKEVKNNEFRVGLAPANVQEVIDHGHQVIVQANAGVGIGATDSAYEAIGATIIDTPEEIFEKAEMIVKVKEPLTAEKIFIHLFDENADTIEDSVQPHVPKSRIATRVPGRLAGLEGQSLPHVGAVGSPRVHVDLAHRGHIAVDVEAVPLVEVELLGTPVSCATTFPDKYIIIESLAEVDRGSRPTARVGG